MYKNLKKKVGVLLFLFAACLLLQSTETVHAGRWDSSVEIIISPNTSPTPTPDPTPTPEVDKPEKAPSAVYVVYYVDEMGNRIAPSRSGLFLVWNSSELILDFPHLIKNLPGYTYIGARHDGSGGNITTDTSINLTELGLATCTIYLVYEVQ